MLIVREVVFLINCQIVITFIGAGEFVGEVYSRLPSGASNMARRTTLLNENKSRNQ